MGRGGALLGKTQKGAGIREVDKTGADGRPQEEVEDGRRATLMTQNQKVLQERYEQIKQARNSRRKICEKEFQVRRLNRAVGFNKWRNAFREETAEIMRRCADELQQEISVNVDCQDVRIQQELKRFEDLGNILSKNSVSHLIALDELIRIASRHINFYVYYGQRLLVEVKQEFDCQKEISHEKHSDELSLSNALQALGLEDSHNLATSAYHDLQSAKEAARNKQLEAINGLRVSQDAVIDALETDFESAHRRYIDESDERSHLYFDLRMRDMQLSRDIETKWRAMDLKARSLSSWRKKIVLNRREQAAKNQALLQEKKQIMAHYRSLKHKANQIAFARKTKFIRLAMGTRQAMATLNSTLDRLKVIVEKGQAINKLATFEEQVKLADIEKEEKSLAEKERHSIFSKATADDESQGEGSRSPSRSRGKRGKNRVNDMKTLREWDALENFYARFNEAKHGNVLLAKVLEQEREENEYLKAMVKEYVDAVNVPSHLHERPNPLLVINGNFNLDPALTRHRPRATVTIDSNQVVRQYAAQAAPLIG